MSVLPKYSNACQTFSSASCETTTGHMYLARTSAAATVQSTPLAPDSDCWRSSRRGRRRRRGMKVRSVTTTESWFREERDPDVTRHYDERRHERRNTETRLSARDRKKARYAVQTVTARRNETEQLMTGERRKTETRLGKEEGEVRGADGDGGLHDHVRVVVLARRLGHPVEREQPERDPDQRRANRHLEDSTAHRRRRRTVVLLFAPDGQHNKESVVRGSLGEDVARAPA